MRNVRMSKGGMRVTTPNGELVVEVKDGQTYVYAAKYSNEVDMNVTTKVHTLTEVFESMAEGAINPGILI
jgi:hypothetical protein